MANDILYLGNKYYSDTEELKKLLEVSDESIKEELLCALRDGNLKQWLLLEKKQQEPIDYLKRRREREEKRKEKERNKQEETKKRKDIANSLPTDFGSDSYEFYELCKSFNVTTFIPEYFNLSEYLETTSILWEIKNRGRTIKINNDKPSEICHVKNGNISIHLAYNYKIIKQKGESVFLRLRLETNNNKSPHIQDRFINLGRLGEDYCTFSTPDYNLDGKEMKTITLTLEVVSTVLKTTILKSIQEITIMNNELIFRNKSQTVEIALKQVNKDFYIGKYVVTESLWNTIMDKKEPTNNPNMPITSITYDEIVTLFLPQINNIIKKEGYIFDLPTEEQWLEAAKGYQDDTIIYPGSNNINEVAWYGQNSNHMLHEVGLKAPNNLGLYDMSGNVYEYCKKRDDKNYTTLHGGSYNSSSLLCNLSNAHINMLTLYDSDEEKFNRNKNEIGFRLILRECK